MSLCPSSQKLVSILASYPEGPTMAGRDTDSGVSFTTSSLEFHYDMLMCRWTHSFPIFLSKLFGKWYFLETVAFELQALWPVALMWNLGHESYFGTALISFHLCMLAISERPIFSSQCYVGLCGHSHWIWLQDIIQLLHNTDHFNTYIE